MNQMGSDRPSLNSYNAGGGFGTAVAFHSLSVTAHRRIADVYGVGATSSVGGEFGWNWSRPTVPWALASSAGYERLRGGPLYEIEAWRCHASVTRRLTARLSLVFDAAYAGSSGRERTDLTGRGVRLTCVWTPVDIFSRRR